MTPDEQKDEQFYRDTESIAFPKLDDHQLSLLEPLGKRRVLSRGELIFKAGQRDLGLTVTLRGEIEVFELRDGTEQILATVAGGKVLVHKAQVVLRRRPLLREPIPRENRQRRLVTLNRSDQTLATVARRKVLVRIA